MIYKILSSILFVCLLVLGGVYLYKDHQHKKETTNLYNQIVELEGTVKEANNAVSARGIEVENLRSALESSLSNNAKLAKDIKNRDEQVIALNNIVLQLKKQVLEITDATETVVVDPVNPGIVRTKVSFDQTKGYIHVYGFTLTNPAYANIALEWTKGLSLTLVLVKDKENRFKTYLDSQNSDIVPVELKLTVDPNIFEKKWYEKIGVGADLAVGSGLMTNVKLFYDVRHDIFAGPMFGMTYDGGRVSKYYGLSAGFYPFR